LQKLSRRARCNQLVENVLTAIIDSIDELDKEITVKILYAKDNIEAPAIEIITIY